VQQHGTVCICELKDNYKQELEAFITWRPACLEHVLSKTDHGRGNSGHPIFE